MGILSGFFGKNDDQTDKYKNNLGETDDVVEGVGGISSDVVIEPRDSTKDFDEIPKFFGDEDNTSVDNKKPSSVQSVEEVNVKPDRMFRIVVFIDGTYSFTTIFKKVYEFLSLLTSEFENVKLYADIDIKYELVVHYEGEENNLYIRKVDNGEGFLNELKNIVFKGGAYDGKDYMFTTIKKWGELQKSVDDKTEDAIFYFSDSIVADDSVNLDTGIEARFARGYQHRDSRVPAFHIVDREGNEFTELDHVINNLKINDLVKLNESEMREEIVRIYGSLINEMSANG